MNGKSLITRATDRMDMPNVPFPWMPLIEIAGNRRVLIEKHKGIGEYSPQRITVRVHNGTICICGKELRVAQMDAEKLIVCGCIQSVALCRKDGGDGA